jgi:PHD/YefM family antitoxin component YafN of YafNO toxin-antitoxin module
MSHVIKPSNSPNTTKASMLAFLEELRQNRQPVLLTINGQKELLVQDAGSYQLLLELVERLETIDGVKKSMEAFERGEGQSARGALEELRQKHDIAS